ncbi:MAG TPA: DUF4242 domain-containing protein [Puia sp.]|nr:DUF4242 domain-containing protein [Puia sp.]
MKRINYSILLTAIMLLAGFFSMAQTANSNSQTTKSTTMKTYLIERDIPDAGKLTPEQLKSISQKSCNVLKDMGPQIEWVQSYVTGDKIFCVYKAENEDLIREHAKKGGFPANVITEISTVISPATAKN